MDSLNVQFKNHKRSKFSFAVYFQVPHSLLKQTQRVSKGVSNVKISIQYNSKSNCVHLQKKGKSKEMAEEPENSCPQEKTPDLLDVIREFLVE